MNFHFCDKFQSLSSDILLYSHVRSQLRRKKLLSQSLRRCFVFSFANLGLPLFKIHFYWMNHIDIWRPMGLWINLPR